MNKKHIIEKSLLTRRGLLKGAGKAAAGIVAASAAGSSITAIARTESTVSFPWGYRKIDPERAGRIAYEGWYTHFCCFGAASGILAPLQKDFGEPYTYFPLQATIWGHGGAAGWGSLCGSLNGAGLAISLLTGEEGEQIIDDVIAWYTNTKLPVYTPASPRVEITQITKSNSALCHISVGKWMRKEGVTFHSPRRWERCARITADIAVKSVSLLNDWIDGKYLITRRDQVTKYHMPTENNCKQCHGSNVPSVPEQL